MDPYLLQLQSKFQSEPLIAAAELRLAHRKVGPELVNYARQWLAAQQEAQRRAQAEARASNERIAQFNAQLSSLGGTPLQYQSAGFSGPPTALSDSLFWNTIEQVGRFHGDPPAPEAFRVRARDVALGKVDVWTSLQLLCAEDPQARAALDMMRRVLDPAPVLSEFQWYRDLTSWWDQTFLGKIAAQFDPMKHAWNAFGMMTRVAGILAVPPGGPLLWLYADLHAEVPRGRAAAHAAALREAASLRDDGDPDAARDLGHVALYIGSWVGPAAELDGVELLVGLGIAPGDRETLATSVARIRPYAAQLGGALAARLARVESRIGTPG